MLIMYVYHLEWKVGRGTAWVNSVVSDSATAHLTACASFAQASEARFWQGCVYDKEKTPQRDVGFNFQAS